jgi:DNA-directed RNA polymerase subunit beta-beta'
MPKTIKNSISELNEQSNSNIIDLNTKSPVLVSGKKTRSAKKGGASGVDTLADDIGQKSAKPPKPVITLTDASVSQERVIVDTEEIYSKDLTTNSSIPFTKDVYDPLHSKHLIRGRLCGSFRHTDLITNAKQLTIESYNSFFQVGVSKENRRSIGLQELLDLYFPLHHVKSNLMITCEDYRLKPSRFSRREDRLRGATHINILELFIRVRSLDPNEPQEVSSWMMAGEIPRLTSDATYIINGHERVPLMCLIKCPGVVFTQEQELNRSYVTSMAKLYPSLGSWLHFRLDRKVASLSIDKKSKIPLVVFLKCLPKNERLNNYIGAEDNKELSEKQINDNSYSIPEILERIYNVVDVKVQDNYLYYTLNTDKYKITGVPHDVYDLDKKKIYSRDSRIFESSGMKAVCTPIASNLNLYVAQDIIVNGHKVICASRPLAELTTAEISMLNTFKIYECNDDAPPQILADFVEEFEGRTEDTPLTAYNQDLTRAQALRMFSKAIGLTGYYNNTLSIVRKFEAKFFDKKQYDLSAVGRFSLNLALGLNRTETHMVFDDIIFTVKKLIKLFNNQIIADDIDSLTKKIVHRCGDVLYTYLRTGLKKTLDSILDKQYLSPQIFLETANMNAISIPLLSNIVSHSHLYNDVNHIAAISQHGKLDTSGSMKTSERIGSAQRDINNTFFSRLCPIQTPEGKKVGIVLHLAIYAKVDEYGFILAPYHQVINGVVQDEVVYLRPHDDWDKIIGDPSSYEIVNNKMQAKTETVMAIHKGELIDCNYEDVELVLISSNQIHSLATSLVPRPEVNDTYRTMVASNMCSQGLVLVRPEPAILTTGMDAVFSDKIMAPADGTVLRVDMKRILIRGDDGNIYAVKLDMHKKTTTETSCTHRPLVRVNEKVHHNQLIADGFTTYKGEIALGNNILTAFIAHESTYEDSCMPSDRLRQQDLLTSRQITVHECKVYDTRLGCEQSTDVIPGVPEEDTYDLDEAGIVLKGTRVKGGDILVGKITPDTRSSIKDSSETNLIKILVNDQSNTHIDSSLRMPANSSGVVIDIEVLTARNAAKDDSVILNDKQKLDYIEAETQNHIDLLAASYLPRFTEIIKRNHSNNITVPALNNILRTFKLKTLESKLSAHSKLFGDVYTQFMEQRRLIESSFNEQASDVQLSYEIPEGVIKIIRVYIMEEHKIAVGDKLTGRCGNKAVISRIEQTYDMPYLEDGTPIDLCLNSLGILARMNNGQISEQKIGVAAEGLRKRIESIYQYVQNKQKTIAEVRNELNECIDYATGAHYSDNIIKAVAYSDTSIMKLANRFIEDGVCVAMEQYSKLTHAEFERLLHKMGAIHTEKRYIYDGRTGERSEYPIAVGKIYIMALVHKSDSKRHARATGPYSSTSLQPTYGKSHAGGQRVGEMETWAFESYGSAYTLKEMITAKSDSMKLKSEMIRMILRSGGVSLTECSSEVAESFRNLACYFMACCMEIQLLNRYGEPIKDWFHVNLDSPECLGMKAKISLMTAERILEVSQGEVKNSETHSFKTFEPIKDGLCDMVIFGPMNDYVCRCNILHSRKYEGLRCPKCNVLIGSALLSRELLGHIKLAKPFVHPLFVRNTDNKVAKLLNMSGKVINEILACEAYVITKIRNLDRVVKTSYKVGDVIPQSENNRISRIVEAALFEDCDFKAETSGTAIEFLLQNIDLAARLKSYRQQLANAKSLAAKNDLQDIIQFNEKALAEGNVPLYKALVLRNLLVVPRGRRNFVELAPGQFATSDINLILKMIFARNKFLVQMLSPVEIPYPDISINLQELLTAQAIAAYIGAGTSTQTGASIDKTQKSIPEMCGGKEGMLRHQMLGKRVDFSGRAVIVVAPDISLDYCYVCIDIFKEISKFHLIHKLTNSGYATSYKHATQLVRENDAQVLVLLNELAQKSLVILNRAPTLHRLSVQSFRVKLWKHDTIGLNPLVCYSFNADFDGDQMAIHIPLSNEAIAECFYLSRSRNNIGSVAHGGFMIGAFKDMGYGLYTLSIMNPVSQPKLFYNIYEAISAWQEKRLKINDEIRVILPTNKMWSKDKIINTTVGRLRFLNIIPDIVCQLKDWNNKISKEMITELMQLIRRYINDDAVVEFMTQVQHLGFEAAKYFGASFSTEDFITSASIDTIIAEVKKGRIEINRQRSAGLISQAEAEKKQYELSSKLNSIEVEIKRILELNPNNVICQIFNSKSRGSPVQAKQIFGCKGNVTTSSGLIAAPILSRQPEGVTPMENYILSKGNRKGVATTALITADAGYLTRKTEEVAQSLIISAYDCGTQEHIVIRNIYSGEKLVYTVYDLILGRTLAVAITTPEGVLKQNTLLLADQIAILKNNDIQEVAVFSPIKCSMINGVCVKCYGADLSKMKPASPGDAVGIIAAQSMGEPSTQLTMKLFHAGGVAGVAASSNKVVSPAVGKATLQNTNFIETPEGKINISHQLVVVLTNNYGQRIVKVPIPYGANVLVTDDMRVTAGQTLATMKVENALLAHVSGKVTFEKMLPGINSDTVIDDLTNMEAYYINLTKASATNPILKIMDENRKVVQQMFIADQTILLALNDKEVTAGQLLGYVKKQHTVSDITTGGLQQINNLLDNRMPNDPATIAPISGTLRIRSSGKSNVFVITTDTEERILPNIHINNSFYNDKDTVMKGQVLSFGPLIMQEVLEYQGIDAAIEHFVGSLQLIYGKYNLHVASTHFEVVLSQMLSSVQIKDGENAGQIIHKKVLIQNMLKGKPTIKSLEHSKDGAKCKAYIARSTIPVIQGITHTALHQPSWLSSISFQTTTKAMTENALFGSEDPLDNIKSSVIVGTTMPAGTGYVMNQIRHLNSSNPTPVM